MSGGADGWARWLGIPADMIEQRGERGFFDGRAAGIINVGGLMKIKPRRRVRP